MLVIKEAGDSDRPAIQKILDELDLGLSRQKFDGFWVAETEGEIAGIARLEDLGKYFFLSCVGTRAEKQKKGIASALLKSILASTDKAVYLYTIIPEFFEKFGFKPASPVDSLPARENFKCRECFSEKCQTMVKLPDVS